MVAGPVETLALCKWLRDRIREWEADAKSQLALDAGERKAAKLNGQTVAFVTQAHGRRDTDVDEDALIEWVKEHHPTEVVEAVRPAFRKKLLNQVINRGALIDADGVASDAVTVTAGEPYPVVKLTDEADITMAGFLRHGRIGLRGIEPERPRLELVAEVPDDTGDEIA